MPVRRHVTPYCTLAIALLAASSPACLQAQERSDPILVTASRTVLADEEIGGSTITREAIEAAQPVTVLTLLDGLPGLRAFEKGGPGRGPYLSIRGGEPNHTLVTIEGALVNDPTSSQGGAFDFTLLSPAAIQSIGVIRSGVASVTGPNSLAGSVNVQLRDLGGAHTLISGRATADTAGYLAADLVAGMQLGAGDALLGAGWSDTDDLAQDSRAERWHVLGKLSQSLGPVDLRLAGLHAEADKSAFPEDSGGTRLAANRELETSDRKFTLAAFNASAGAVETGQVRLIANWQRHDNVVDTPAIFPGTFDPVPAFFSDTQFDRAFIGLEGRWAPVEQVTLALGAAYEDEEGTSTGVIDIGFELPTEFDVQRDVTSAFGEIGLQPVDAVQITAGLRHDDPSTRDGSWTYRIAGRAELGENLAAIASIATSEKLPSLFALAFPLIANPDLEPERARNLEAGLEYRFADTGLARVTFFDTNYRDLIDFAPELFTNVNRGQVAAQGIEAELRGSPTPSLQAGVAVTYLDTTNFDGPPLRSRPEWQFAANARWQATERLSAYASLAHIGASFDSSIPTGLVELDAHFEGEVAVEYDFAGPFALRLAGVNLFDDYENAIGFPVARRALRLTVRLEQ